MTESEDIQIDPFHVTEIVKGIECDRKVALRLANATKTNGTVAETILGTAAHVCMELYVNTHGLSPAHDVIVPESVTKMVIDTLALEYIPPSVISDKIYTSASALVSALQLLPDHIRSASPTEITTEYHFNYAHPDVPSILTQGTADVVVVTGDKVVVLDWKTGSGRRASKAHEQQVAFYSAIIGDQRGLPTGTGYLVYARGGGGKGADDPVVTPVNHTMGIATVNRQILEFASKYVSLLSETPDLTPCNVGYGCRYCPYNGGRCRGV